MFAGGIALTAMPSVANMRLAGVWNLTGGWNEPPSGTSIKPNSTVTVSGTLDKGYNINIGASATLAVDFTAKSSVATLDVTDKTVTLNGDKNIAVNVTGTRPSAGWIALTSGAKFGDANVSLAPGSAEWAREVRVDGGEIQVLVPRGLAKVIR